MPPRTPWLIAPALGLVALLLGTAWLEPWGIFIDEHYYWIGAKRLEFGYVDHPPLAPWLLAAATAVLGDGRLPLRLVPALCGAGTVLLTGEMARRLGARANGQVAAGLAAAVAPFFLVFFSFYSVNAIEILLWTLVCALVVEQIRSGNERLWLAVGVAAGLALLNKHTFALLGAGLAVGMLATPWRAQLRSRWLWLGAGLALAIALPNLVWNATHGFASLEFYRSRPALNIPTTIGEALTLQIIGVNPASVLLWLPGAAFLLFAKAMRPYRPLGIAFAVLLAVILFSGQRRGDRIAAVYPMVLAAGVVFWQQWEGRGRIWLPRILPGLQLGFAALFAPVLLPLIEPASVEAIFEAIDESPEVESVDAGQKIPLHLRGRLGWEPFVEEVIAAWQGLPPEERARSVILTPHWAYASVIEYYGRERELPPVVSPHNAYVFWHGGVPGRDVAVAVDIDPALLEPHFGEVEVLRVLPCALCVGDDPEISISVVRRPNQPLGALLSEWEHLGVTAVPALRPDWP